MTNEEVLKEALEALLTCHLHLDGTRFKYMFYNKNKVDEAIKHIKEKLNDNLVY